MQNIELNIQKYDKYFITEDYVTSNSRDYFNNIEKILGHGVKLLQFRSKNLSEEQYANVSMKIYDICKKYNSLFFINDLKNYRLNKYCHGIHLTSENLLKFDYSILKKKHLIAASCHNKTEINICNKISVNFIVTSPIHDTGEKIGLGWKRFKDFVIYSNSPVFALGGMNYSRDIYNVKKYGGQGIAAISYFYELFDT